MAHVGPQYHLYTLCFESFVCSGVLVNLYSVALACAISVHTTLHPSAFSQRQGGMLTPFSEGRWFGTESIDVIQAQAGALSLRQNGGLWAR